MRERGSIIKRRKRCKNCKELFEPDTRTKGKQKVSVRPTRRYNRMLWFGA